MAWLPPPPSPGSTLSWKVGSAGWVSSRKRVAVRTREEGLVSLLRGRMARCRHLRLLEEQPCQEWGGRMN